MPQLICRNCDSQCEFYPVEKRLDVLRCSRCDGYQYQGEVGNLASLYSQSYYEGEEYINYGLASNIYKINFQRKCKLLTKTASDLKIATERILEIGCATGEFLDVLQQHGAKQLMGAEVSQFSREVAKKKGFNVIDPLKQNFFKDISAFDPTCIIAWDVWEHIENPADLFKSLFLASPSLQFIAISTVNSSAIIPKMRGLSWRQFHPPTHLNYPSEKSFEIFFKKNSFEVLSNSPFGYYRPLADYLSVFGLKADSLKKYPLLFKTPIYLNLYDIQLVIAQKKAFV